MPPPDSPTGRFLYYEEELAEIQGLAADLCYDLKRRNETKFSHAWLAKKHPTLTGSSGRSYDILDVLAVAHLRGFIRVPDRGDGTLEVL